jgi:coiled-coil and C2 domain-containing protein 1
MSFLIIKQFEDAIKATREGKQFDYNQLVVPPGFASIPLQNGRPILGDSSSSSNRASQQVKKNISPPASQNNIKTSPKKQDIDINEEASDDLLEQLENEIDENELEGDDDGLDPEDDHIRKQLSSLMPNIKKLVPKDDMMDDFEKKTSAFLIPEANVPRPNRTSNSQLPKSNSKQNISPPQPQPQHDKQVPKTLSPINTAQAAVKPKIQNKELAVIYERQKLFKEAALKAKQEGNVNVALVYLRHAKVILIFIKKTPL